MKTDATMRCVSTDWVLRAPSSLRWSDRSSFLTPRMVRIMRSAWHFRAVTASAESTTNSTSAAAGEVTAMQPSA